MVMLRLLASLDGREYEYLVLENRLCVALCRDEKPTVKPTVRPTATTKTPTNQPTLSPTIDIIIIICRNKFLCIIGGLDPHCAIPLDFIVTIVAIQSTYFVLTTVLCVKIIYV